jgi:hypothetical protein
VETAFKFPSTLNEDFSEKGGRKNNEKPFSFICFHLAYSRLGLFNRSPDDCLANRLWMG